MNSAGGSGGGWSGGGSATGEETTRQSELRNVQARAPSPNAVRILTLSDYDGIGRAQNGAPNAARRGFEILVDVPFALEIDTDGLIPDEAEAYVEHWLHATKIWVLHADGERSTGVFAFVPPRCAAVRLENVVPPAQQAGASESSTTAQPLILQQDVPRIAEFSEPISQAGSYVLRVFSGNKAYGQDYKLTVANHFGFNVYAHSTCAKVTWSHAGAAAATCEYRVRITRLSGVASFLPLSQSRILTYSRTSDLEGVGNTCSLQVHDLLPGERYRAELSWRLGQQSNTFRPALKTQQGNQHLEVSEMCSSHNGESKLGPTDASTQSNFNTWTAWKGAVSFSTHCSVIESNKKATQCLDHMLATCAPAEAIVQTALELQEVVSNAPTQVDSDVALRDTTLSLLRDCISAFRARDSNPELQSLGRLTIQSRASTPQANTAADNGLRRLHALRRWIEKEEVLRPFTQVIVGPNVDSAEDLPEFLLGHVVASESDTCVVQARPSVVVEGSSARVVNGEYFRIHKDEFSNISTGLSIWREPANGDVWWIGNRPGCRYYFLAQKSGNEDSDDGDDCRPCGTWSNITDQLLSAVQSTPNASTIDHCENPVADYSQFVFRVEDPDSEFVVPVNIPPTSRALHRRVENIDCEVVSPLRTAAFHRWFLFALKCFQSMPVAAAASAKSVPPRLVTMASTTHSWAPPRRRSLGPLCDITANGLLVFEGSSDAHFDETETQQHDISRPQTYVPFWTVCNLRHVCIDDDSESAYPVVFVNVERRGRWMRGRLLGENLQGQYDVLVSREVTTAVCGTFLRAVVNSLTTCNPIEIVASKSQRVQGLQEQFHWPFPMWVQQKSTDERIPYLWPSKDASPPREVLNGWSSNAKEFNLLDLHQIVHGKIDNDGRVTLVNESMVPNKTWTFDLSQTWHCEHQDTLSALDYEQWQVKSSLGIHPRDSRVVDSLLPMLKATLLELQSGGMEALSNFQSVLCDLADVVGATTLLMAIGGASLLHIAAVALSWKTIALLRARYPCDLFARDAQGFTIMHSILTGASSAVGPSQLIGAEVVHTRRDVDVARCCAALLDKLPAQMRCKLVQYHSKIQIQPASKSSTAKRPSPLMVAAENDLFATSELLLSLGSDIWAQDESGRIALDLAPAASRCEALLARESFASWRRSCRRLPPRDYESTAQNKTILSIVGKMTSLRQLFREATNASDVLTELVLMQCGWNLNDALELRLKITLNAVTGSAVEHDLVDGDGWIAAALTCDGLLIKANGGEALQHEELDDVVSAALRNLPPQPHASAAQWEVLSTSDDSDETQCVVCESTVHESTGGIFRLPWDRCRSEGHWCCRECWCQHLAAAINAGKVPCHPQQERRISCCGCDGPLALSTIDMMLCASELAGPIPFDVQQADELLRKLAQNQARYYADCDPALRVCPNGTCNAILDTPPFLRFEGRSRLHALSQSRFPTAQATIVCPLCHEAFCANCRTHGGHDPISCKQWNVIHLGPQLDNVVDAAIVAALTQSCPRCRRPVTKDGGCLHMTCSTPCCHQWCWACRAPWAGHAGSYFTCRRKNITHIEVNAQQTRALQSLVTVHDPYTMQTQNFFNSWDELQRSAATTLSHMKAVLSDMQRTGATFDDVCSIAGTEQYDVVPEVAVVVNGSEQSEKLCNGQAIEFVLLLTARCTAGSHAGFGRSVRRTGKQLGTLQRAMETAMLPFLTYCEQNSESLEPGSAQHACLASHLERVRRAHHLIGSELTANSSEITLAVWRKAATDVLRGTFLFVKACSEYIDLLLSIDYPGIKRTAGDAVEKSITSKLRAAHMAAVEVGLENFLGSDCFEAFWGPRCVQMVKSAEQASAVEEIVTAEQVYRDLQQATKLLACTSRWASLQILALQEDPFADNQSPLGAAYEAAVRATHRAAQVAVPFGKAVAALREGCGHDAVPEAGVTTFDHAAGGGGGGASKSPPKRPLTNALRNAIGELTKRASEAAAAAVALEHALLHE